MRPSSTRSHSCAMSRKAPKSSATSPSSQLAEAPRLQLPKLFPKQGLQASGLYPETQPTIFTIPDLLTPSECQALTAALPAGHPFQRVAHAQTRSIAWRDVDRCVHAPGPALLWHQAGEAAPSSHRLDPSADMAPPPGQFLKSPRPAVLLRVEFRSPALSELLWAAGLAGVMSQVPIDPSLSWAGLNTKWRVYR